jgi:hypothetical protein
MTDAPDWAGAAGLVGGYGQAYTRLFASDRRDLTTASSGALFSVIAAPGAGKRIYLLRSRLTGHGAVVSPTDLNTQPSLFDLTISWQDGVAGSPLAYEKLDTLNPRVEREYASGAVVTSVNTALYLDVLMGVFGDGVVLATEVDYFIL